MKNDHIAFISHPQYPHVGPVLPILSVLIRRGYRVTCVTSNQFASRVRQIGAEWVECPRVPTLTHEDAVNEEVGREGADNPTVRLASDVLRIASAFYENDRPALILYDYAAIAGRVLARRYGIPAVKTSPMFAHVRPEFALQVPDEGFRHAILEYGAQIDRYLEQCGIAAPDWVFHREALNIYLFPRVLQPGAVGSDERCYYAGRCPGEQPYYGNWQKSDSGGRPIVLVGTSTHYVRGPEYFKMCIKALSALQWHVILSIGDSGDPKAFDPLPPHVEIVQHTSHVRILPHVSLYVCLGGIITSAEAAYHGIPLIVTTHGFQELEWEGENLARVGVGIHLRKADTSAESLRASALRICADQAMHRRVREVQRLTRAEPGSEEAANRIEEYLERHSE